ncbi:peptidylprolyl isomerase [Aneurinibacillus sp. Ricciae_BoGa-3]|uniref:peptidylprolyl isomerase n=1 Tax=Aneurinibacillus sp. Ricciae_BoGa-3 TaxID=3022697 RepID=UPI0023411AAA|nr:peptidylprolyl isomerase [Aneurinibacillus sp. Ricciae_BoGa-3]WCK55247.1 peptidylprolyl isomerase [Aneurinibacillus sp. Ricciae_BoGa-3]
MKKTVLWVLVACVFAAIPVIAYSTSTGTNNVVVDTSVGQITKDDLYNEMKKQYGNQVLQQMIYTKLLEKNFPVSDQEVNDEVQRLKKSYTSTDAFNQALAQNGIKDETELKQKIRENLLQLKAATKDAKVSDADVKKLYEQNKVQVRASHILVKDLKTANDIEAKLNQGQDFATLAKQYSTDTSSAANGGDLGFFGKGLMTPEFEKAAFSLPVGKISAPVKTQFGYHIIKVTQKRVLAYADMEKDLRRQLLEKQAKPVQPVLDELVKKDKVNIKDKDLANALTAQPAATMPPQQP